MSYREEQGAMGINQACTNTNMDEVLVNQVPELQDGGRRTVAYR